jgi:hypothetical protein
MAEEATPEMSRRPKQNNIQYNFSIISIYLISNPNFWAVYWSTSTVLQIVRTSP